MSKDNNGKPPYFNENGDLNQDAMTKHLKALMERNQKNNKNPSQAIPTITKKHNEAKPVINTENKQVETERVIFNENGELNQDAITKHIQKLMERNQKKISSKTKTENSISSEPHTPSSTPSTPSTPSSKSGSRKL